MNAQELNIFNTMPVLFSVRDRDGRYLWVNNALSDLAHAEMVGKTDADFSWSDLAESFRDSDRRIFETGETEYITDCILRDELSGSVYQFNYCKWLDEFEKQEAVFVLSLVLKL